MDRVGSGGEGRVVIQIDLMLETFFMNIYTSAMQKAAIILHNCHGKKNLGEN